MLRQEGYGIYYASICLERLKEIRESVSQDNQVLNSYLLCDSVSP